MILPFLFCKKFGNAQSRCLTHSEISSPPAAANTRWEDVTRSSIIEPAYAKANSANVLAQAAYNTANIANTRTISSLANSSYTLVLRSDGQLIVPQSTQGSITAGYVTSLGSIGFNANGNLWKFGEDGTMNSPYSVQITTHGFQWPDGTYQNTAFVGTATDSTARTSAQAGFDKANTANVSAQAAFDKANSANVIAQSSYNFANTINTYSSSAYAQANTANVTAQAAFNKANTAITTSGGSITGQLNVTYAPATTVAAVVNLVGANTKGGIGYSDVLQLTNSSGGATNVNKWIRLTSTGEMQIINNTYTTMLMSLSDSGDLTVAGNVLSSGVQSGYNGNRPAFRVYGAGTTNISATNTLTSSNFAAEYNQGGYLNTGTGVFTAPVGGMYQVNLIARYGGSASISAIQVQKTSGGTTTTQVYLEWGGNSTAFHMGGASVVKMSAGDTLKLIVTAGTVTFDANDCWSVAYLG